MCGIKSGRVPLTPAERSKRYADAHREERRAAHRVWVKANPDKARAATANWRANNPEKCADNERRRAHHRDRTYGTGAQAHFDAQLKEQGGTCPLCSKTFTVLRDRHFDHNHDTEQWRGVLCYTCNVMLGRVENTDWMKNAAAYLSKWATRNSSLTDRTVNPTVMLAESVSPDVLSAAS